MAISVVIPAFNAGRFIRRTIDSVLAQTYSDYEIIVVDDGSTDNTGEVVKSYGSKVRYIYQENAGDGPARNTGIAAANGEWIAFLDHDDEWLPQRLEKQIELLKRNPELRWCGANFYKRSGDRRIHANDPAEMTRLIVNNSYFEHYFAAVNKGCQLFTTTMLIHREVFENCGVFEGGWLRCADLDMWWRIAYSYPRIGYICEPLAILHIEIQDVISTRLRLQNKRGTDIRKLLGKHLKIAKEQECLVVFRPCASKIIRRSLVTNIFHGFKSDARECIKDFGDLLPWFWRFGAVVLTIFPNLTSAIAKRACYFFYKLGLSHDVSRRWISLDEAKEGAQ